MEKRFNIQFDTKNINALFDLPSQCLNEIPVTG